MSDLVIEWFALLERIPSRGGWKHINGFRWRKVKRLWIHEHPPDEHGNYKCAFCEEDLSIAQLSLDHIIKVAHLPQLAFWISNLQPMHPTCNVKRDRLMTDRKYLEHCLHPEARDRHLVVKMIQQTLEAYKAYEWLFNYMASGRSGNAILDA